MKKRILSIVLASVMLVSLLPLPALAAGQSDLVNLSQGATMLAARPEQKNNTITVVNGTATVDGTPVTSAPAGTVVTLTADPAPAGLAFDHWEVVSGDIDPERSGDTSTTFIMPASDPAVEIKAVYSKNITQVSIDGLAMPVLGAHPDFEAALPENAPYHLASHQELRDAMYAEEDYLPSCNGIWWIKDFFTMDPLCLTPEMTFDDPSAEAYTLLFALVPDEGYQFDDSCTVSLNGNSDLAEPLYDASRTDIYVFSSVEMTAASAYTITAEGGTASYGGSTVTSAPSGAAVTLTADPAPRGQVFDYWEVVSGKITLADAHKASTTFTMPAGDVKVKAVYANAITHISIDDLTLPVLGEHPDFEVSIPQNAHYRLATHDDLIAAAGPDPAVSSNYGGVWWWPTDDYDTPMTPDMTFDSPEEDAYYMQVVLSPSNGYRFAENVTASINGTSALVHDGFSAGNVYTVLSIFLTAQPNTPDNQPAAPADFQVVVRADGKPYLTWDAVEGADKYEIERADGKGGFHEFFTAKGTSDALRHGSAKAGETYTYRIRTVKGGEKSPWVESKSVQATLAAPEIHVTINSKGKPVITWDKVAGAEEYEVICGVPDASFEHLYGTKTGTRVTHGSAKTGQTYVYAVMAKAGGVDGQLSKMITVTALATPVTHLENRASDGKPVLTWDKVPGADHYDVYRKVGKNGSYKLLKGNLHGTSLRNGSAKAGTTYYYYVVAVTADGAESLKSSTKYITCDLARPDVSARLKNGKPYLSWNKVDGAIKYEVYRSVNGGSYKLLTTVKGTHLTNGSAKKGQTCKYRVKAICSNKYGNSALSYIDTVKVK